MQLHLFIYLMHHPPSEILPAGQNLLIQKVHYSSEIISGTPFPKCCVLLFWNLSKPGHLLLRGYWICGTKRVFYTTHGETARILDAHSVPWVLVGLCYKVAGQCCSLFPEPSATVDVTHYALSFKHFLHLALAACLNQLRL